MNPSATTIKMHQQEKKRWEILEQLAKGQVLSATLDSIVALVEQESPHSLCSILLLDPDGRHLRHGSAPTLPSFYNEAVDGIAIGMAVGSCGTAAFTKRRVIVEDIEAHPFWIPYRVMARRAGVRSCWSEPILSSSGEVLGTFAIYHRIPQSPTPAELEFISIAAHLASIAIERKRSVDALEASELKYRDLVETSQDLIWSVDVEGRWTFVNRRGAWIIYGYKPEEMLGRRFTEFQSREQGRSDMQTFEAIKSGLPVFGYETVHVRKDGRTVVLSFNAIPVLDSGGRVVGTTGTAHDITGRRQSEDVVVESRRILRTVLDNLVQGVFWKDRQSRYLGCNQVVCRAFGLAHPDDIVGKSDHDLTGLAPSEADFFVQKDRQVMDADAAEYGIIEPATLADGTRIWMETNKVPMHDAAGNVVGVLGTWQDITERKRAEEALRQSETRLRTILDSEPECVKLLAVDGTLLEMNHAGLAMIEADSPEQVVGHCIYSLVVESHQAAFRDLIRQVFLGQSGTLTFESVGLKGGRRWMETHASPLRGPDGRITALLSVTRDVTEHKRAEEAMRKSEELFRVIWEHSADGMRLTDETGTVVRVNEAFCKMMARPREAIEGRPLALNYALDRQEHIAQMHRKRFAARNVKPYLETEVTLWNGESRWFAIANSFLELDGMPPLLLGIFRDITERRKADELLRSSTLRLNDAQSIAHIGSYFWDLISNEVTCSDELYRIHGLDLGSALSLESYLKRVHPEDRVSVEELVQKASNSRDLCEHEYRIQRPTGEMRWIRTRIACAMDAMGKAIALHGTCQDITERKQAEEDRRQLEARVLHAQKLESLGVLAGGIAHDFNNLLTSMLGYANLALMELPTDSVACPMLREIENAALRAADLARQMLAYSGKGKFVVQTLRLDALVQEMTKLLETVVSKKAVLHLDLAPATMKGDATQIRQVVMNLITNASDALSAKAGTIAVRTGVREVDAAYLRSPYLPKDLPAGTYAFVEVEDNGCGMDADTLARIFDPFFTTKFTGRGLGLAAVLGIVSGHQGTIKATSTPARGTHFEVLFPCVVDKAVAPAPPPPGESRLRGDGTILIVEDDAQLRVFARLVLEGSGFQIIEAADGQEGIDQFHRHRAEIDAVLLDLTMPHLDGAEVLQRLRQSSPTLPVVIMSGFSEQDVAARIADLGSCGFIQKPFTARSLSAQVCKMIKPRLASLP